MAMLNSLGIFAAKVMGAAAKLAAAGLVIGGAVTVWNRNVAPTANPLWLSCSSPEVLEGARRVFFKALVRDALNRMGGQTNPDWSEGIEALAGMCVDDLANHSSSAECSEWLKALKGIRLIHITTVNHSDAGDSCRADGFSEIGPVVREFEYVFKTNVDAKNVYIRGRLTGQWYRRGEIIAKL